MRTLPLTIQTAIAGQEIWPVRMVSIQIGDVTYRISDHYRDITFDSNTFLPNGVLLSIDNVFNSTVANQDSVEVSLSAIDAPFRADILNADSIGGDVSIYRGLINPSTGNLLADPIMVYEGIIYSVTLSESNVSTIGANSIELTGFTAVAEVRATTFLLSETPGRFTNDESNRRVDPDDASMEFIAGLNGRNIRFGGTA